ncbi:MAG TPA: hypothetical protein VFU22_08795 [Roseiflexaceae bacterium]|nr:hypothetical protein [Roseiflexaceae bacterium]
MTEREYDRDPRTPAVDRRDVYVERQADAPPVRPDDAAYDVYRERVSGPAGEQVVQSEHVSVPSEAARRSAGAARATQVIYFIFGIIEALLAIRFILLALAANEASGFVRLIYALSRPFVLPFLGIFGEPSLGASVLEWASLVGIVVYALVAFGLSRLIELIYRPTPRAG